MKTLLILTVSHTFIVNLGLFISMCLCYINVSCFHLKVYISKSIFYLAIPMTPHAALAPAFPVALLSSCPPLPRSSLVNTGLFNLTLISLNTYLISMNNHGASNNGVFSGERNHFISNGNLSSTTSSLNIAKISSMPLTLCISRSSMGASIRVEVRSSACAPVSVVTKLVLHIIN